MSIGLSEDACWAMTMRQIVRAAGAYEERRKRDAGLWAAQTAELVNMIGGAAAGKKWKQVTAMDYFKAWTGYAEPAASNADIRQQLVDAQREHERKVEAHHADSR